MTSRHDETIGEEIGRRRTAARLSQSELARRAGVYRDTIGNVEIGKTKSPQAHVVHALRTALDQAEASLGIAAPTPTPPALPSNVVRVSIHGHDGKTYTVEAPPENVAELERLVDVVMANLRRTHPEPAVEG